MDTQTSYRMIASDLSRSVKRVAQEPIVSRETDYYRQNIGNVKSVNEFMADNRLYNYALKSFGLSDMAYAKAFVRKVLTEGVENKDALANRLVDKRYKELAATFDFAGKGAEAVKSEAVKQGVIDRYLRQTLETEAGQQNEGVRLALYFQRKAPTLTSAYEILGDRALLSMVQTALGWPAEMGRIDIDKQAKMLEEKIDFRKLKEPDYISKFITRFTAMYETKRPNAGNAGAIAPMLLGGTSPIGISNNILTTLQGFKPGRF